METRQYTSFRPTEQSAWVFLGMVRVTDRLDMTIDVDWDVKAQNNNNIYY